MHVPQLPMLKLLLEYGSPVRGTHDVVVNLCQHRCRPAAEVELKVVRKFLRYAQRGMIATHM